MVYDVSLDDEGRLLLVTSGSTVTIYDLQTRRVTQTFSGHEEVARSATFVTPREAVASVGDDGTLRLWDQGSGQELLGSTTRILGSPRSPSVATDAG